MRLAIWDRGYAADGSSAGLRGFSMGDSVLLVVFGEMDRKRCRLW